MILSTFALQKTGPSVAQSKALMVASLLQRNVINWDAALMCATDKKNAHRPGREDAANFRENATT